jgi:sodium-dependent phosphate cotransporter
VEGLKTLIKPIVHGVLDTCPAWLSLVISLLVLFASLTLMVKIMRSIFIRKMARILDRFLFRNAVSAFVVGVVFTILVQSSSVTTSLIVPLVGAGILTLRQIFPYTLGANIGTTVTAFLAALALAAGAEPGDTLVGLGVTVALVHLLFNIFGIVLIYPIRAVPIWLAEWLARHMTTSPQKAVVFLIIYFLAHIAPLAMLIFT